MSYQFSFDKNREPKKVEAEIPASTPEPVVEEPVVEEPAPAPVPAPAPKPQKKGKDKSNNII